MDSKRSEEFTIQSHCDEMLESRQRQEEFPVQRRWISIHLCFWGRYRRFLSMPLRNKPYFIGGLFFTEVELLLRLFRTYAQHPFQLDAPVMKPDVQCLRSKQ